MNGAVTYPTGCKFAGIEGANGMPGVADAVLAHPGYATCISKKMLSYGLGRLLTDTDTPYLDLVNKDWLAQGQTPNITRLIQGLVKTETFRSRRGEGS